MKRTRDQKKAGLLTHEEAVIEELSDWDEETERPHLRQIEEVVVGLAQ